MNKTLVIFLAAFAIGAPFTLVIRAGRHRPDEPPAAPEPTSSRSKFRPERRSAKFQIDCKPRARRWTSSHDRAAYGQDFCGGSARTTGDSFDVTGTGGQLLVVGDDVDTGTATRRTETAQEGYAEAAGQSCRTHREPGPLGLETNDGRRP